MNDLEADLLIANAKIKQLEQQLTDYHHLSKLVNGKIAENQRLRRINENLQSQLADSQRREQAAVELIAEVEKMINAGAEWFDAGAGEWGAAMERYRGEPGEEHRFELSMHIRDAYRIGIEKFDLVGAKIDRWRGPQEAGKERQ